MSWAQGVHCVRLHLLLGGRPRVDGGLVIPRVRSLSSDDNGEMAGEMSVNEE